MTEEEVEQEEETEEEESEEETVIPDNPEDLITRANAAAIRVEEANKVTATLLNRQEALKVQDTLGGTASAGSPSKTKEQKEQAEAKKYIESTGLDPFGKDGTD